MRGRTKHIDVDIHFTRDRMASGFLQIVHVLSHAQLHFHQANW